MLRTNKNEWNNVQGIKQNDGSIALDDGRANVIEADRNQIKKLLIMSMSWRLKYIDGTNYKTWAIFLWFHSIWCAG